MLRTIFSLTSFGRPKIIATILLVVATAAFVKGEHTNSPGIHPHFSPTAPAVANQSKKVDRFVETEMISLRPTGFEPAEITRPAGEFVLEVENRAGQPVNLRFDSETGEHLHDVRASREQSDWNELEDLHPGHYLLTEAGHPEWMCRVTVTSH